MTQQTKQAMSATTTGDPRPVLIVGAGPTGMTAAMELARCGVPIRIVDKLLAPSTTTRALAVQARTLELFEQRGLSQEMLRIGNKATTTTIYGSGQCLGKVHLEEIESRHNYILLLSQSETERILREQLDRQGVSIERGVEMIACTQLSSGMQAVLRNQEGELEELEAAYLFSAEGAHSTARHILGLPFEGKSRDQSYALADLHLDGDLPDDELSIFLGEQGFLAVFPMGDRHFRFIATDPENHPQTDREPTLTELQQLCDADSHIPLQLRDLTWSSRFRINSRMLPTLRKGDVFFGGDAAHIHSPAGGQGMNTGIQDTIDLSWKLALVLQGKAVPELLDTYEEDRLPVIRSVVTKTETATDAFNSNNAIVHQLIAHIAPVLLNTHFVQQLSTELISEVAANYRSSSLSQNHHARGHLRAGDRVPDLDIVVWSRDALTQPRAAHLYEILDPSFCTLLVTSSDPTTDFSVTGSEQLRPWDGVLKMYRIAPAPSQSAAKVRCDRSFGNGQSFLLVRPDSYLGFVGGKNALPELIKWLNQWFPAVANRSNFS
jgi:2-polyprenyl-6-methoxyphenol hydroxylase-like FAD-dependent oxidoreductase